MWGIPVGIALGCAGYTVNRIFVRRITASGSKGSGAAILVALFKFIILYGALAALVFAGAEVMLCAAGGYAAALISLAFFGRRIFRGET